MVRDDLRRCFYQWSHLLYIMRNRTLKVLRYRNDIFRPIVVFYAAASEYELIIMDDKIDNIEITSWTISFRRRDFSNGLATMFYRYESHRPFGEHTREKGCESLIIPRNNSAIWKITGVRKIPLSFLDSLIDCMSPATLVSVMRNHTPYWNLFISQKLQFCLFV